MGAKELEKVGEINGYQEINNKIENSNQETPKKRGRGRPRKTVGLSSNHNNKKPDGNAAENKTSSSKSSDAAMREPSPMWLAAISFPYNQWARINNLKFLELSKDEARNIAIAFEMVVEKYFPKIASQHQELYYLGYLIAMSTGSRMIGLANVRSERAKQEQSRAESSSTSNDTGKEPSINDLRAEGVGKINTSGIPS